MLDLAAGKRQDVTFSSPSDFFKKSISFEIFRAFEEKQRALRELQLVAEVPDKARWREWGKSLSLSINDRSSSS